jgi:sporulation protein YlmC with PRC-barrel domain
LEKNQEDDPHLRSSHQVTGYIIHATDGEIGHVEDFVIDDENWTVRHIVVKTGNWFLERKVLISTAWIKSVDWAEGCVNLDRTRDFVKNSPEFVTD